jgi:hypothetical protein
MGMGGVSVASGLYWIGLAASFPLVVGVVGVGLGAAYLASPTWRFVVAVDDDTLAVVSGPKTKLRVRWKDIVRVVASPSTKTCFIDSGDPATSLLVPGDGAPAPYAIEDRAALYDLILARVDPAVVTVVETLRSAAGRTD